MSPTPTITDLARALNLSISSVSYALNGQKGVSEATRRRVLEYAARVGYVPNSAARALSRSRVGAIGVVIRESYSVIRTEPYYLRFLAGVASTLEHSPVELIVKLMEQGLDDELAVYRRWAAERRVDGVILLDEEVDDPRVPLLESVGLACVLHGTTPAAHPGTPAVLIDDGADARTIAEHLAARGSRRLLHAAGPPRHRHEVQRAEAVAAECRRLGLAYERVVGPYSLEHGEGAARRVTERTGPRPDAIVAANDLVAVGACRMLAKAGAEVPRDCRVVAWDDSVLCEIARPAVSALDRGPDRYGAVAAQMLLERLDAGRDAAVPIEPRVLAPSALIARDSS